MIWVHARLVVCAEGEEEEDGFDIFGMWNQDEEDESDDRPLDRIKSRTVAVGPDAEPPKQGLLTLDTLLTTLQAN